MHVALEPQINFIQGTLTLIWIKQVGILGTAVAEYMSIVLIVAQRGDFPLTLTIREFGVKVFELFCIRKRQLISQ